METNGGDIIARFLKNHNVKTVFTLCGGHISPVLVIHVKLCQYSGSMCIAHAELRIVILPNVIRS